MSVRVAVLRGGPSSEYEVSLKSGGTVLKSLPPQYKGSDILIDRKGVWHLGGVASQPHHILNQHDVVFNALHGEYGEDGTVQKLLESFSVPYTGSRRVASAIGIHKVLSKEAFLRAGILTPRHRIISLERKVGDQIFEVFRTFSMPAVIKPTKLGSSVGITIARDFASLEKGIRDVLFRAPEVMIEEFVSGKEVTCGVVENFRGSSIYPLFPVEIVPPGTCDFFDYHAKYSGESHEICPARLSSYERETIQDLAVAAHRAIGARHYSRSDFIITPRGNIYILEINTLPGLTTESLLPKSIHAVGSTLSHFFDHVLTSALRNR